MTVRILTGDCRDVLRTLEADSVDCVITSPPYWGLRSYLPDDHADKTREIGLERTLGEHISNLVDVFSEVRRVIKPRAAVWINYGDCYATTPNGRSAADTKAAGNDDRTFRDKPFSTIGPIYDPEGGAKGGGPRGDNLGHHSSGKNGRVVAGGYLKPKDLCLIPFRLAIALQEDGWWVRSRCIWGKPNGMPDSSGRYRPSVAHEEIFLLSKSGDLDYDFEAVKAPPAETSVARWQQDIDAQQGSTRGNGGQRKNGNMKAVGGPRAKAAKTPRNDGDRWNQNNGRGFLTKSDKQRGHTRRHAGFNDRWDQMSREEQQENGRLLRTYEPEVWHIATAAFTDAHFATFPPALVERCITATCAPGLTVLDPFGGSGTVGLVADRMGRNAVLIDLSEQYTGMATKRVEQDCPMFAQVTA